MVMLNKKMKEFCKKKLQKPDYYTEVKWYSLLQPITILLGPNGTGKSTSIKLMQQELSNTGHTNVIAYSTTQDDTVKKHTTPFDMRVKNKLDRFNLVIDAVNNLNLGELGEKMINDMREKLIEHANYIVEHGEDIDEVKNWKF